jgi:hypothetical protein
MTTEPTPHPVYSVLHRPMLFCKVDRRLFLVALGVGCLVWNVMSSFLAATVAFLPLYAGAWWATRRDPQMVSILLHLYGGPLRHGLRLRTTVDPLKWVPVHIVIRHGGTHDA